MVRYGGLLPTEDTIDKLSWAWHRIKKNRLKKRLNLVQNKNINILQNKQKTLNKTNIILNDRNQIITKNTLNLLKHLTNLH